MSLFYNKSTGVVFQQFSKNVYSGILTSGNVQYLTVPDICSAGNPSSSFLVAVITVPNNSIVYASCGKNIANIPNANISLNSGEMIPKTLTKIVKINDKLSFVTSEESTPITITFYQN